MISFLFNKVRSWLNYDLQEIRKLWLPSNKIKDTFPSGNLGISFLRNFNIKTSLYKHKLFSMLIRTFVLLMTSNDILIRGE